MAQGKKYNDDIKEKAFALLAVNNSVSAVARELKLPYTTVKTWEKQLLAKSKDLEQKRKSNSLEDGAGSEVNEELDLVKLRKEKKQDFVNKAWNLIENAQTILERRLKRAIKSEDVIDELVSEICALDYKELSAQQRITLYHKIASIKVESIKEITVAMATLYDKQALANEEPTSNVKVNQLKELLEQINKGGEY